MTVAAPRRPQARPQSTPRPPARPGRPVGGAAQQCPLRALAPCDPKALAVATKYDTTPMRRLATARRLRGTAVRGAPPDVAVLLRSYDLVIDTIAGYPSNNDSAPKKQVSVAAATELLGRCSRSQHPRVTLGNLQGITVVQSRFYANPLPMDRIPGTNILGFFGFLAGLFPGRTPVLLPVRAPGCGRRAPGAGAAVTDLNAMVRVFRAGKWSAKITLPPTGRFTKERAGTQRTAAATGMLSHAIPGNKEEGWSPQAYAQEVRTKLSVSLKRNGVDVPGAQRVTQLISTIVSFRDIVLRIFVLLQSFPQFGWKFEGSVSVLEGSIEAKWEPELITTPECGGRYLPVRPKIELVANLKLVDAQAAISFGVLADSETLRSRIEARVEGRVGLSVAVNANVPFAEHRQPMQFGITTRGFVRARAVGTATVLGRTLANVSAQVEGALALKQGRLSVGNDKVGFGGALVTEEVKLEAECSIGGLGPAKVEFKIFPEKTLMRWNEA